MEIQIYKTHFLFGNSRIMKFLLSCLFICSILITALPLEHVRATYGLKIYNYTDKEESLYTGKQIKVTYNGNKISNDLAPAITMNGAILYSCYDIITKTKMGASYTYDKTKGTVTIQGNDNRIKLTIGSKVAIVNGNKMSMPTAPVIIKFVEANMTRIMVPAKFLTEALDYGYNFYSTQNEIVIKADLYGNVSGNIAQGGRFVYSNGWLYTIYNDSLVYKVKLDGSQKKLINNIDSNSKNLNVKNGCLYYLIDGSLYRNNLDGSKKHIINNSDNIRCFIIKGNYIYYINYDDYRRIYRMNLDGSGRKKFTSDINCNYFNITKSYIFYSTYTGLYRINLDGTNRIKLLSNGADQLVSDSVYIYFINSDTRNIYKIKFDGTELTQLNKDDVDSLNIFGKTLYYQNEDDYNKLYAITTDGKIRTKVYDKATYNPSIINGYLYYTNDPDIYINDLHRVKLKELVEVKNNPDSIGNSTENIVNNAFTAYGNSKIYFCDPFLYQAPIDYQDNSSLVKYIFKDYNGFYEINVAGDYIYYTESKEKEDETWGAIYKVKADGTEAPIELTSKNAAYLTVIGDWIYFTDNTPAGRYDGSGTIFKIKTNGTGLQAINPWKSGIARYLSIVGNYIYYINESDKCSIYRMSIDGTDIKRLSTENNISSIHVYGDQIYYKSLNNQILMKMPIDGGAGTMVLPRVSLSMIVYNDRIYYFLFDISGFSLYSCKLDGSDNTLLKSNVLTEDLNITEGFIYFENRDHRIERIKLDDIQAGN